MNTPTYRYASDSFPPSARSIGAEEELFAVDPIVETTWNARRGRRRAVQNAGLAAIAVFVGMFAGLAGGSNARGAMVAWGTMGDVHRPAIHAVAAARGAVPLPPVVEEPAPAPVVEAPATAKVEAPPTPPATQPVMVLPVRIAAKAARAPLVRKAPPSVVDDPYADAAPAPRAAARVHVSDPYDPY